MIIVMNADSTQVDVDRVLHRVEQQGLIGLPIDHEARRVVEVQGVNGKFDRVGLEADPMVDQVVDSAGPMLAADRKPGDATFEVPLGEHATIGAQKLAIIAGPCCVESKTQLLEIAAAAKEAGAVALRGGAFKPRTSPYSFQGHGEQGLEWLALAREKTGLAIVTEVMRCEHVDLVARYADVLQIGSRNMHHTHLLAAAGAQSKPVLLKRGWSATLDEFLQAAEYVMLEGNRNVILCERGIRTHETYVRNTLALSVVPHVKQVSRLPIIVDPSHGTGRADLVSPMSNAAIACGADGLLVEIQRSDTRAWTDAAQSLDPAEFNTLIAALRPFAAAAKRTV